MSYLHEFPGANMQDFLYGTDLEAPFLFLEVARSLIKSKSQLTHKEREMIVAFVAYLNNAHQPVNVHTRNFVALGGESWIVQDLGRNPANTAVEPKFRPLIAIARKLTEQADGVTKDDVDACYDAGWNGHTVHLVISLASFLNHMTRWVNSTGFTYSQEEVIGSSEYLIGQGYGPNDSPGLTDDEYKKKYPDYMDTTFVMKDQGQVKIDS
ncbi:MAG: hypothetical protein E2O80_05000 [Betaproteobacteria bacterium]|nr:MAG: hypothetical protein E2O80_05000 [Betaproteobacteria bacterium]